MDEVWSIFLQIEPAHWFALGLALLVAEIVTGTTYLLWPAAAAAVTGALGLFAPGDVAGQWAVFAILTIVLTLTGHFYVRGRWLKRNASAPPLNERARDLIGQQALADDTFVAGLGRVRLNDTVWRAASAEAIGPGEKVEVVAVDGATLQVKRA
jgi:membrane protein implicated in regulation of membrane protease activity